MEATMNARSASRLSEVTPPNLPLSVRVSAGTTEWSSEDPMSPTGRLMEDMGLQIVVMLGLGTPLNLPVFRAGIQAELLPRYPRFCSIQVVDDSNGGNKPRWVQTTVNVDDHIIIVPMIDPTAMSCDPEKAVEDYVASLSMLPMDRTRPLWEIHFLNAPTSEAASTAVLRLHHSIGDGMSIMTLLMASSRSTAEPARLPAMPPPPKRAGPIYQRRPRPPLTSGGEALLAWAWSYLVLAWNTLVDTALLIATIIFLTDPCTLFKRADGSGEPHRPKRFVHRSLNLDDVKLIKTVMNCTINDVLVGVTSAALSQYYFRKSGDIKTKRISLRSLLAVNTRPMSSRQTYITEVQIGNRVSSIMCPIHIALYDDPLEYVRKAKSLMNRKKSSLEVMIIQLAGDFSVKYCGVKIGAFIWRLFVSRTTIILSNMVGPAEHITLCGHPIAFMATSIYGQPQALTVHYLNYGSTMKVVMSVDDAQFPDCHQLLDDFADFVRLIKDAANLHTLNSI